MLGIIGKYVFIVHNAPKLSWMNIQPLCGKAGVYGHGQQLDTLRFACEQRQKESELHRTGYGSEMSTFCLHGFIDI